MTTVIVAGIGAAVGLVGMIAALRPTPPSLQSALAALDKQVGPAALRSGILIRSSRLRLDRRLGVKLALATERDIDTTRLRPLLAITGKTSHEFYGEVVLGAAVGLVLPGVTWLVVTTGGVRLPFAVPVWTGLVLGGGGALLPAFVLRSQARQKRRSARKVIGSFLNLVVLCLAGGMGIEGALHEAARIGEDEISEQMVNALVMARDTGEPPWDALDRLGRELGVSELTELAAAVGLAGVEGARIRATLTAKANSIRRHRLAEAESDANTVTERLFLPGVFLLLGFLIFIAYPAVARISAGL